MTPAMSREEIRAALVELVSRPGGFCRVQDDTRMLDGASARLVSSMVQTLTEAGLIHPVRLSHRTVRYFATAALADAFRSSLPGGAPRSIPRPVVLRPPSGEPAAVVVPASVKVTIAPVKRDTRFVADPDVARLTGGFVREWEERRSHGQQ